MKKIDGPISLYEYISETYDIDIVKLSTSWELWFVVDLTYRWYDGVLPTNVRELCDIIHDVFFDEWDSDFVYWFKGEYND